MKSASIKTINNKKVKIIYQRLENIRLRQKILQTKYMPFKSKLEIIT